MSELEKRDDELEAEKSQENSSADDLAKELEEIRDMFQEALDNAGQEETGEIIQELDDVEEDSAESYEEEEAELCDCCQEAPRSKNYGEGYPYCDNCRQLMKHYPLRISGVISVFAMVILFGLTLYFGGDTMDKTLTVIDAYAFSYQNKMMSTVQSLYSMVSDEKNDSKSAATLLIDGFVRTGYVNNAKELAEETFSETELKLPWNSKYKKLIDFVNVFLATRDASMGILSDVFSGGEFDYDELAAELDKIADTYYDEEKGIKLTSVITEYYKYELLKLSNGDLEAQLEILKGIEAEDKDGLANWIYEPSICEVACKMGDKELAEEYFAKMTQNNAEDMKAYTTMALYYRYLDEPDADAIIELCETAEANAYSGDTSFYPALVVAYLIKGEGALAYETMTEYMSSNYYTVSNCNLYALCALYCGNTDTYDQMVDTLKNSNYEINELVAKYKDGKATIEEVLAEKRGDIG